MFLPSSMSSSRLQSNSSSNIENDDTDSSLLSLSSLQGKTIYQRTFYRLPLVVLDNDHQQQPDESNNNKFDNDDLVDDEAFLDCSNAMVIEEQLRYQIWEEDESWLNDDDENDKNGQKKLFLSPVGPGTLILRDGQVEPGKIGNIFCTLDLWSEEEKNNNNNVNIQCIYAKSTLSLYTV